MIRLLSSFISGSLFGLGLLISGMTNTLKIQGWLNFLGDWDPTLAFVLFGAILPMFIAWKINGKINTSLLGTKVFQNDNLSINSDLLLGSLLFGAGWGLVGLCPGPAIASISYGGIGGYIFIFSMLTGMLLKSLVKKNKQYFTKR